jgi:hypothetical protein
MNSCFATNTAVSAVIIREEEKEEASEIWQGRKVNARGYRSRIQVQWTFVTYRAQYIIWHGNGIKLKCGMTNVTGNAMY